MEVSETKMGEAQHLEDQTFRELNLLVSKWFDKQRSVNMKVLYREHIHNTIELNKCSGTMDLLDLLISHGHLSKYDISILYDTIAITKQFGLQMKIKDKQPSIHIPNLKKHVITNFSKHRQRIVKFGMALTERDVHQICGLYDLQKSEDSWSLIQELEHKMIICEENMEEFIDKLKKQELLQAVKALTEGAELSVILCKCKQSSSDFETRPSPKKTFDESHTSEPYYAQSNQPLAIDLIIDLHKNKGTLRFDDKEKASALLKDIFSYYQNHGFLLEKTTSGSLVFHLFTYDHDALINLWKIHQSGNLLQDLAEILVAEKQMQEFTEKWMTWIDEPEYKAALGKLETKEMEVTCNLDSLSSYLSSSGTSRTYVDNPYNRSLGRVGMEHGSMPVSSGSANLGSTSPNTYVDNAYNRSLGRVGMERGTMPVSSRSISSGLTSSKTYVDNAYNRHMGRVGKVLGTMPISKTSKSSEKKVYADNAKNRILGRAGKPFESMPETSKKTKSTDYLQRAYNHYMNNPDEEFYPPFEADIPLEAHVRELFSRMELSRSQNSEPTRKPFEWYEGPVIQFSGLEVGKKIGHGGFGDVHHGKLKGKEVVIKKLRVQRVSQKRLAQFEGEVRVLCKLRHKNIITFYGACITTPNLCIVMEYMNGSLYDELHVKEHQFNEKEQMFIAMEIANGLMYLHSENVAHCDVKPANVLINIGDVVEQHQVKITDFGLSMIKKYSQSSSADELVKYVGTPRYSAPEVLRGEFLDTSGMMVADVYSFGLVMFEIFSGDEVFNDYDVYQLKKNVGDGKHQPDVEALGLSDGLQALMLSCWCRETIARPTAKHCFTSLKELY